MFGFVWKERLQRLNVFLLQFPFCCPSFIKMVSIRPSLCKALRSVIFGPPIVVVASYWRLGHTVLTFGREES
jgi:hypothetical protein